MHEPGPALRARLGQSRRMVVVAPDNLARLPHVTARRTNRCQVHHQRELRDALHNSRVGQIRTQELAPLMIQAVLQPVEIEIHAKNAPAGTFQHGVEQMATDKTTATHDGHGETTVVEAGGHYSLTLKVPDLPALDCLEYG